MFHVIFTLQLDFKKVEESEADARFKNFGHAAASIRKDAAKSIRKRKGPSPAGEPPHTHKGNFLRRAIRFAHDKESAIIGPRASIVGQAGAAHEFGGNYKGQAMADRPFMGPALERGAPRFAETWSGSIGE